MTLWKCAADGELPLTMTCHPQGFDLCVFLATFCWVVLRRFCGVLPRRSSPVVRLWFRLVCWAKVSGAGFPNAALLSHARASISTRRPASPRRFRALAHAYQEYTQAYDVTIDGCGWPATPSPGIFWSIQHFGDSACVFALTTSPMRHMKRTPSENAIGSSSWKR